MSRRFLQHSTSDVIGLAVSGKLFAKDTWSNGGFQKGYTSTGKRKIQALNEGAPLKSKPFKRVSKKAKKQITKNLFPKLILPKMSRQSNDDKSCDRKTLFLRKSAIKGTYRNPIMTIKNQQQYIMRSDVGRQGFNATQGTTIGDYNNAIQALFKSLPTTIFNNAGYAINDFNNSLPVAGGSYSSANVKTVLGKDLECQAAFRHEIANISNHMVYMDAYLVKTKRLTRYVFAYEAAEASIEGFFLTDGGKKRVINNENTTAPTSYLGSAIATNIIGEFPNSPEFRSEIGVKKIWTKILGPGQNVVLNVTCPQEKIKLNELYEAFSDTGLPKGSYCIVYKIRGPIGIFREIDVANTASNPTYLPAEIAVIESRKLTVKYTAKMPVKKMTWNRDGDDEVKQIDGAKTLWAINPESDTLVQDRQFL
jgi:hypothetical protein